jgi:hypothetical protein
MKQLDLDLAIQVELGFLLFSYDNQDDSEALRAAWRVFSILARLSMEY